MSKKIRNGHSKITEEAIELFVCGVDVSFPFGFRIQEYFARVDVTIACGPVQGHTSADEAENQQHIFKQTDAGVAPAIFCVDVSFRIQQHSAHVGKTFRGGVM
jgi:hypothetical protein